MPISLRDPEIPLGVGYAAADRIGDPFGHRCQLEATVEAEAVATEVPPGVHVNVEACTVPLRLVLRFPRSLRKNRLNGRVFPSGELIALRSG